MSKWSIFSKTSQTDQPNPLQTLTTSKQMLSNLFSVSRIWKKSITTLVILPCPPPFSGHIHKTLDAIGSPSSGSYFMNKLLVPFPLKLFNFGHLLPVLPSSLSLPLVSIFICNPFNFEQHIDTICRTWKFQVQWFYFPNICLLLKVLKKFV